ncbi:hypothetical protein PHLGIDRAFT_27642, partial [Phlebiopsis gigantea 11061_1 CR5-6]
MQLPCRWLHSMLPWVRESPTCCLPALRSQANSTKRRRSVMTRTREGRSCWWRLQSGQMLTMWKMDCSFDCPQRSPT